MSDNWRRLAACRGMNTRIFFPERSDGWQSVKPAKAVCARCPVTAECLEECLSIGQLGHWGVWGGTSDRERRQMKKKGRNAKRPPEGGRF